MTQDDVTQFCIEEAVYERLEHQNRRVDQQMVGLELGEDGSVPGIVSPGALQSADHAERMRALRGE